MFAMSSLTILLFQMSALLMPGASAQGTGGVITPLDLDIGPWTSWSDYPNSNKTTYGPTKLYSEIKGVNTAQTFNFDVYEKTASAGDDFHTDKDPYWSMVCAAIVVNDDSKGPSHIVMSREKPWVSGNIAKNIWFSCDKGYYKCHRDKCEGEYAMPTESIDIVRQVLLANARSDLPDLSDDWRTEQIFFLAFGRGIRWGSKWTQRSGWLRRGLFFSMFIVSAVIAMNAVWGYSLTFALMAKRS
ncbi:uncharacterized protein I303_106282 [Kwoniella dejecticola CBS 10117]|uniref:Uncharacterized protein n=1 Tax=Kwoniella dejecticola CBS 10117 TaxID=1296121 RepID=A0A1A6A1T8_9TREE|nr:uncharacterized protein I303_06301 [Kwoniella dejecticola CBS 10117]OBR84014.1 hypothetical protein I303_06301 [Kwoniella dejecticola CBS 10117]